MTGGILTIWALETEPPTDGNELTYRWTGYAESGTVRSLMAHIDRHSERLRQAYVSWVQDLGDATVDGITVVDHLAQPDGLSYWWMTLLVEQSPWKSPAIMDAIRLLAFGEVVSEEQPNTIRLVGGDTRIDEALRIWCAELGVNYSWDDGRLKQRFGLRGIYRSLPQGLQAFATLCRYCIERWPLRKADHHEWTDDPRAVFFCSYFIHLDEKSCEQGRFLSRYWEHLPRTLSAESVPTNWLQCYLRSSSVPDVRTALAWVGGFNARFRTEGHHTFLDAFLSWPLAWRVLKRFVTLFLQSSRLGEFGASVRAEEAPSLWPVMRGDWISSTQGAAAAMNVLWMELYDAALRVLPTQQRGVYLMENQSWERAFIHAWRKHGHGKLIATVHATVRFWDLRYAAHEKLFRARSNPLPQPDVIAVNGPRAMSSLRDMAYPGELLVEAEALRYSHVTIMSSAVRDARIELPLRVLVVTDYHDAGTRSMMRILEAASVHLDGAAVYTVKPHPNLLVAASDYPSLRLAIATDVLATLLPRYDVVFASNNTSASVDAFVTGVPVIVALDESELNFSPLYRQAGVRFVSNGRTLANALRAVREETDTRARSEASSYFYLDDEIPRWRRILGIAKPSSTR